MSCFFLVLLAFRVSIAVVAMIAVRTMAGVMLVELLGSVRPLEFMAFAGNAEHADGHEKQ